MARNSMHRSPSTDSARSNIVVRPTTAATDSTRSSIALSSTPPTSLGDASAAPLDAPKTALPIDVSTTEVSEPSPQTSPDRRRSTRARHSDVVYNESALSGTDRHIRKDYRKDADKRTISGETLVEGKKSDPSLAELDEKTDMPTWWLLPSGKAVFVPGANDTAEASGKPATNDTRPRRSNRRLSLSKAAGAVTATASALGKRVRGAISSGKEKLQSLVEEDTEPRGAPPSKRTRITSAADEKASPLQEKGSEVDTKALANPPKRSQKKYLNQGLFLGQDYGLDAQHKSKKSLGSDQKNGEKSKVNNVMPLPSFVLGRFLEGDSYIDFKLPYNILNPLDVPFELKRPDKPAWKRHGIKNIDWHAISKNKPVGDAVDVYNALLKESRNLAETRSLCQCTPENGGCEEQCLNRLQQYECTRNNCNLENTGVPCHNRQWAELDHRNRKREKRVPDDIRGTANMFDFGIEIMKTENRGYGVRAMRGFAPGQIITEYKGEIITRDECDERISDVYKDKNDFYMMEFVKRLVVDATKRGCIARYVNHSCSPNCKIEKWDIDATPRMALFAGDKGIEVGEELTYDYNFAPFSAENVQECRCGAANCRGFLGPKPKEAPKPKKEKEKAPSASKKRKRDAIEDSDAKAGPVKRGKKMVEKVVRAAVNTATQILPQLPSTTMIAAQNKARSERAARRGPSPSASHPRKSVSSITIVESSTTVTKISAPAPPSPPRTSRRASRSSLTAVPTPKRVRSVRAGKESVRKGVEAFREKVKAGVAAAPNAPKLRQSRLSFAPLLRMETEDEITVDVSPREAKRRG